MKKLSITIITVIVAGFYSCKKETLQITTYTSNKNINKVANALNTENENTVITDTTKTPSSDPFSGPNKPTGH